MVGGGWYVEGSTYAADHRVISVASLGVQQKAEDSIEGDRVFRLRGGYDRLPKFLAERIAAGGGKIYMNTAVKEIRWTAGRVEAMTEGGSFVGRQVVVAISLGVLQGGGVSIMPRPEGVFEAAEGLRMGQARRFTLVFRERFWEGLGPQPAMGELSFLFAFEAMPPVWWTPHPEATNSITGWVEDLGVLGLPGWMLRRLGGAGVRLWRRFLGWMESGCVDCLLGAIRMTGRVIRLRWGVTVMSPREEWRLRDGWLSRWKGRCSSPGSIRMSLDIGGRCMRRCGRDCGLRRRFVFEASCFRRNDDTKGQVPNRCDVWYSRRIRGSMNATKSLLNTPANHEPNTQIMIDGQAVPAHGGELLIDLLNRRAEALKKDPVPQVCYVKQMGPIQSCDTCMVQVSRAGTAHWRWCGLVRRRLWRGWW